MHGQVLVLRSLRAFALRICPAFISAVSNFRCTLGVDETWPKQFGKSHEKLARYRTVRSSFFCLLLSVALIYLVAPDDLTTVFEFRQL